MTTPPRPVALDADALVTPLPLEAGGSVWLRGAYRVPSRDLVIDACASGRSGAATALPGPAGRGAFALEAGGLRVTTRDFSQHECEVVATGEAAPACALAGVSSPCLVSRLPAVANEQELPLTYEELRRELSGELTYAVRSLAAVAPPPPPVVTARGAGLFAAVALGLTAALALAVWRGRRARDPFVQAQRAGARVLAQLRGADPVYASLAPRVKALLEALAGQRAGAREAARQGSEAPALRARHAALRAQERTSQGEEQREHAAAATHVEARLREAEASEAQARAFAARVVKLTEYLRALEARLTRAQREAREQVRVRLEEKEGRSDDEEALMREAERAVDAAFEGAREADALR